VWGWELTKIIPLCFFFSRQLLVGKENIQQVFCLRKCSWDFLFLVGKGKLRSWTHGTVFLTLWEEINCGFFCFIWLDLIDTLYLSICSKAIAWPALVCSREIGCWSHVLILNILMLTKRSNKILQSRLYLIKPNCLKRWIDEAYAIVYCSSRCFRVYH
jgi:hypothetical protein